MKNIELMIQHIEIQQKVLELSTKEMIPDQKFSVSKAIDLIAKGHLIEIEYFFDQSLTGDLYNKNKLLLDVRAIKTIMPQKLKCKGQEVFELIIENVESVYITQETLEIIKEKLC